MGPRSRSRAEEGGGGGGGLPTPGPAASPSVLLGPTLAACSASAPSGLRIPSLSASRPRRTSSTSGKTCAAPPACGSPVTA
eukprot:scaffold106083_cov45-Phaeocystis_antarctica.AAC.1